MATLEQAPLLSAAKEEKKAMNPLLGYPPLATAALPTLRPGDLVRVRDQRVGEVVGFYRNDEDLVLVRLEDGESRRYARGDLRPLIG
jgi:hypothetical protein